MPAGAVTGSNSLLFRSKKGPVGCFHLFAGNTGKQSVNTQLFISAKPDVAAAYQ